MGEAKDFVLAGIQLFNERRYDESLEAFTEDIEWRTGLQPLLGLDATRGREAVLEFWREAHDGWDDFRVEPQEAEEISPDAVLVTARYQGRGHVSGVEIDNVIYSVYRLRDGLICSVRDYATRDAALASIEEEAGS